jgi:release factor glutamine methyltransferase
MGGVSEGYMCERLAWEKNLLLAHGWSQAEIEYLQLTGQATPVEYLVGETEWLDLKIKVSRHVLIPRRETEKLVQMVKEKLKTLVPVAGKISVVEVGTGSGAIAMAIAKFWPSQILALDISPEAVAVARDNVRRYGLEKKVLVLTNNLLTACEKTEELKRALTRLTSIWILVANLPYVPTDDWASLDKSVRDFEPRLALDGGRDGFNLISKLLAQVEKLNQPPKMIFLELDPSQTVKMLKKAAPSYKWQRKRDEGGWFRYGIGEQVRTH